MYGIDDSYFHEVHNPGGMQGNLEGVILDVSFHHPLIMPGYWPLHGNPETLRKREQEHNERVSKVAEALANLRQAEEKKEAQRQLEADAVNDLLQQSDSTRLGMSERSIDIDF